MLKSSSKLAHQRAQVYLADINGVVNTWEEGDHYVVQVTANDREKLELALDTRKPKIAGGSDVAIGDVLASEEGGAEPLVSPMAGKAEVTEKAIIITPSAKKVLCATKSQALNNYGLSMATRLSLVNV